MHMKNLSSENQAAKDDATRAVLGIAKKLHRAATAESLAVSLPVLRRILATATLRDISLTELRRRKQIIQRKHILMMLAIEAGFPNWEKYRKTLDTMTPAEIRHFDLVQREAGYPNLWFSTAEEAQQHAAEKGGVALQVGQQGVVVKLADRR